MEFAGGGDLYSLIKQKRSAKEIFEEDQIWSFLIQLVLGLKYLHTSKIVHWDLKSANCFLTESAQVLKIGDLNVSKLIKEGMLYT